MQRVLRGQRRALNDLQCPPVLRTKAHSKHSAGENMDVFAGGAHLGYGEIVIIEDTIGVRIADFVGEE